MPRILAKGRGIGSKHRVDLKLSIGRAAAAGGFFGGGVAGGLTLLMPDESSRGFSEIEPMFSSEFLTNPQHPGSFKLLLTPFRRPAAGVDSERVSEKKQKVCYFVLIN